MDIQVEKREEKQSLGPKNNQIDRTKKKDRVSTVSSIRVKKNRYQGTENIVHKMEVEGRLKMRFAVVKPDPRVSR